MLLLITRTDKVEVFNFEAFSSTNQGFLAEDKDQFRKND